MSTSHTWTDSHKKGYKGKDVNISNSCLTGKVSAIHSTTTQLKLEDGNVSGIALRPVDKHQIPLIRLYLNRYSINLLGKEEKFGNS